jgi:hypothetical protein
LVSQGVWPFTLKPTYEATGRPRCTIHHSQFTIFPPQGPRRTSGFNITIPRVPMGRLGTREWPNKYNPCSLN